MNKRQVLANLNQLAYDLEEKGFYKEAESITNYMIKLAWTFPENVKKEVLSKIETEFNAWPEFKDWAKMQVEQIYKYFFGAQDPDTGFMYTDRSDLEIQSDLKTGEDSPLKPSEYQLKTNPIIQGIPRSSTGAEMNYPIPQTTKMWMKKLHDIARYVSSRKFNKLGYDFKSVDLKQNHFAKLDMDSQEWHSKYFPEYAYTFHDTGLPYTDDLEKFRDKSIDDKEPTLNDLVQEKSDGAMREIDPEKYSEYLKKRLKDYVKDGKSSIQGVEIKSKIIGYLNDGEPIKQIAIPLSHKIGFNLNATRSGGSYLGMPRNYRNQYGDRDNNRNFDIHYSDIVQLDTYTEVLIEIYGIRIPFYRSSGSNPKPGIIRDAWYPYMGSSAPDSNWHKENLDPEDYEEYLSLPSVPGPWKQKTNLKSFFGLPELQKISALLDKIYPPAYIAKIQIPMAKETHGVLHRDTGEKIKPPHVKHDNFVVESITNKFINESMRTLAPDSLNPRYYENRRFKKKVDKQDRLSQRIQKLRQIIKDKRNK